MSRTLCLLLGSAALTAAITPPPLNADQTVRFDVPPFTEGRPLDDPAFLQPRPAERLLEFQVDVAAGLNPEATKSVNALELELQFLDPRGWIHDYAPQYVAESGVEGVINVESTREHNAGAGLKAQTAAALWNLESHASGGNRHAETLKYARIPEAAPVVSSTLFARRSGVTFKILRSPHHPVEGIHPLRLILRVPSDWRSSFLRVTCTAISHSESPLAKNSRTVSRAVFLVPLVIEGDAAALAAVGHFRDAERQLRIALHAQAQRRPAAPLAELVGWRRPGTPVAALDAAWLERVLTQSLDPQAEEIRDLPQSVSIPLKDYLHARRAVTQLPAEQPSAAMAQAAPAPPPSRIE